MEFTSTLHRDHVKQVSFRQLENSGRGLRQDRLVCRPSDGSSIPPHLLGGSIINNSYFLTDSCWTQKASERMAPITQGYNSTFNLKLQQFIEPVDWPESSQQNHFNLKLHLFIEPVDLPECSHQRSTLNIELCKLTTLTVSFPVQLLTQPVFPCLSWSPLISYR